MIDFPIDELFDEQASTIWLERHLHPEGLRCPRCQNSQRRVACRSSFTGYRCKACDRYYTILARELVISRKHMHKLRHRVQQNLLHRLPTSVREDEMQFEADELYQNSGEKKRPAYGGTRPAQAQGEQSQGPWHV